MTSATSIYQNVMFLAKKTFLNVAPKLPYLDIFGLELRKATVLSNFKSVFSKRKISAKNKNP